ncbi:two-component system, response regulator YesN [Paenibacillus sp. 1_12]|uniref:response regulator transcription factor n=1 Tax=Paenibacillus sp. 1_12 TaxID=1566278 RepID=UPI0008EDCBC3|nr:response regulator [Paenibacillus sp. 1_12]SFL25553.1 two-component system, response regulator YesN [Paenibacillus sp. 1_12]
MNQLLLVEDEPLFRKGLAKMIAGSGTNWNVCGEAENGQEAEKMIAELVPDLVITDIRMPLMNGLELLKRVKSKFPDIEFIIITGFQDFEYAQTALRYGALDLLVKPCSKVDVYEALDKVYDLVLEKQARLRKEETEHQLLLENTLRAIFLRSPYQSEAVAELERGLNECKLIVFRIIDYYPSHKQYTRRDVPLLQFAVLNIISELLDTYGLAGKLLLIEYGRYALLLSNTAEEQAFCDAVCETVPRLLGLSVSTYHAGLARSLTQLADLYEAGMKGTSMSVRTDNGMESESVLPMNRARQQLISAQMVAFIGSGQMDALKQYLDQFIQDAHGMSLENGKMEALSLSFALQDTARKQFEQLYEPQILTERISKLHKCGSTNEVNGWMQTETERFFNNFTTWQQKYSENAVFKAERYMEEHYSESLPLQQVASHVHLNASYFSHLFKKETGRSFIDYLIELRMEKAKQLLSNTDMKITEISGRIGYDLPNYFAKLFKQATGLSPKDYRKLYQS